VFGVQFGLPHVASALLFALVHLVAVPQPHRLLVFFPGLVFAWLAERSGGALAPAVHHTLANLTLQVLQRCYR
jgi:membrane protease YdiL (CAAX protease family)